MGRKARGLLFFLGNPKVSSVSEVGAMSLSPAGWRQVCPFYRAKSDGVCL
jgi:hypothetical protein